MGFVPYAAVCLPLHFETQFTIPAMRVHSGKRLSQSLTNVNRAIQVFSAVAASLNLLVFHYRANLYAIYISLTQDNGGLMVSTLCSMSIFRRSD